MTSMTGDILTGSLNNIVMSNTSLTMAPPISSGLTGSLASWVPDLFSLSSLSPSSSTGGVVLALQIAIAYIFFLWITSIIWVIKDITARSDNLFFQLFAVFVAVCGTPFIGLPLYIIIRPRTLAIERYLDKIGILDPDWIERLKTNNTKPNFDISSESDTGTQKVGCGQCGTKFLFVCGKHARLTQTDKQVLVQCMKENDAPPLQHTNHPS
jgi:hypothetical protein